MGYALTQAVAMPSARLPADQRGPTPGHALGECETAFQRYPARLPCGIQLVWDRGTHFGLQSGGRTESIPWLCPCHRMRAGPIVNTTRWLT